MNEIKTLWKVKFSNIYDDSISGEPSYRKRAEK